MFALRRTSSTSRLWPVQIPLSHRGILFLPSR